jgi:hypothetical protein
VFSATDPYSRILGLDQIKCSIKCILCYTEPRNIQNVTFPKNVDTYIPFHVMR